VGSGVNPSAKRHIIYEVFDSTWIHPRNPRRGFPPGALTRSLWSGFPRRHRNLPVAVARLVWLATLRPRLMASTLPSRPRQAGPRKTIAIVGLLDHARRELEDIAPGTEVILFEVPGAFELPIVVQAVAEAGEADAVIAFGLLLEGQTAHAKLISESVTHALMQIGLRTGVPIIHEVLVVQNEQQARARCIEDELNRGTEAARVAMRMAQVMGEFPRRTAR
jgi:6,7-dimethyl-8-ribityllumazine synthase